MSQRDETLVRQLQAAYGALTAAQVAVENALTALTLAEPVEPEPEPERELADGRGDDDTGCAHELQNASTMGMEPRSYCARCRHFVYPDGSVEPAVINGG